MARSGIGVIVNPLSRKHREAPALGGRLREVLNGAGVVAEAGTPESLEAAARDFQREGIDVLAVSGGDGTASFVLTAFERAYRDEPLPKVALLRGGTMNTVANGLGVPRGTPEKLLSRLVQRHSRGEGLDSSARVTLRVQAPSPNGSPGESRLGFLFGIGLGYGFLEEYYRRGDPHPTPADAAKTLARLSASIVTRGQTAKRVAAKVPVSIVADGRPWTTREYMTVLAGTVPEVGLGFRPFFRMEDGVDAFHLVGVHGPAPKVVARLPNVRAGKPLGEDCAEEALLERATLSCPKGGVVRYFLDGDLFQTDGDLQVEVGPRIRFVAG
ncbi:MAG: diacylglycerol kinase [Deltaproteobacteria bacterium]|nr:diacylglycerol kinase [Deltaproteobacteria bacterium]